MPKRTYTVYILRCRDRSLYTGIALDVNRRLEQHRNGTGAKYLRGRGPLRIVWKKQVGSRSRASKLEAEIKGMKKKDKEAMIRGAA